MSLRLFNRDLPREVVDQLRLEEAVAVDTETTGLDWRNDALALCQVASPNAGIFLVRIDGSIPTNLSELLGDGNVIKVFHFAPFDLRFLMAHLGVDIRSIRCTKAASRLLDPRAPHESHSLRSLLESRLGVRVDKGSIRTSNWTASTLSQEQVRYAAGDVSNLLELYSTLHADIVSSGKSHIYERVCAYMPIDAYLEVNRFPNPLKY